MYTYVSTCACLKYRNFNYYKNRIRPRSVRQSARGLEQGLSGGKIIGMQRSRRIALRQLEISISDLLLVAGACPGPQGVTPVSAADFRIKRADSTGEKTLSTRMWRCTPPPGFVNPARTPVLFSLFSPPRVGFTILEFGSFLLFCN